jgi:signal peptidase II
MHVAFMGIIAAAVLAADQVTKHLIETGVAPYSVIPVFSFFNIVHFDNRGISFGLFASDASYAPIILALAGTGIIIMLVFWALRAISTVQRAALAAIIGGAASNVIDRLGDGGVTDFLDFHLGSYHWPAFNLADAAIVCGVAGLLLQSAFPAALRTKDVPR